MEDISLKVRSQTCSGNDDMWPCAIAQRDYLLPAQAVYPSGFDGALDVTQTQASAGVCSQGKHL